MQKILRVCSARVCVSDAFETTDFPTETVEAFLTTNASNEDITGWDMSQIESDLQTQSGSDPSLQDAFQSWLWTDE